MEYEIDDDPQGLPDVPDGDRDGGVRASAAIRKGFIRRAATQPGENAPREQLGELA